MRILRNASTFRRALFSWVLLDVLYRINKKCLVTYFEPLNFLGRTVLRSVYNTHALPYCGLLFLFSRSRNTI